MKSCKYLLWNITAIILFTPLADNPVVAYGYDVDKHQCLHLQIHYCYTTVYPLNGLFTGQPGLACTRKVNYSVFKWSKYKYTVDSISN